jgi:hypothetical protein
MKRIAISMITLMAGGILSAQITPQAAQAIQSQARSTGQSAKAASPASSNSAQRSQPVTAKPVAAVKAATPAVVKPGAATTTAAKPSGNTAIAKPAAGNQTAKVPVPAPNKAKPVVATLKPALPKASRTPTTPKPAVQKVEKAQPKVKEAMVKTEAPAPEPKAVINVTGRRDPFTSPVTRALAINQGPGCSSGKRCLAVDQMILRGIVRSPNGMIAVVENGAKRAYFLRENDPIWHGVVEKISGDSVTFREETIDSKTGKTATHEVVKRVNAPVV